MRSCLCPGSFDPITNGHLDIIERATTIFDHVVVAVLHNPTKTGLFSALERVELARAATAHLPHVEVRSFANMLVVDVAKECGADVILKGLRSEADYAYELPMATANRQIGQIETLFLPGDLARGHLSSSLIKQVAELGGDVTEMVPPPVHTALRAKFVTSR